MGVRGTGGGSASMRVVYRCGGFPAGSNTVTWLHLRASAGSPHPGSGNLIT